MIFLIWIVFPFDLKQQQPTAHDHLPTIAYLKSIVPETTRFLLIDGGVERNFLAFLDPEFHKRITWITRNDVYHIKGSLTVAIPVSIPIVHGCCMGWDPLREWLANVHPDSLSDPKKKLIVFYTRGGTTNTHHGRIVDVNHEAQIIEHIQAAMVKYKRPEQFLTFSGQVRGVTLDYVTQFVVFRAASVVIGPHGSGLGGNLVWTNPFASSCKERTQLLEFIPGQESAQVQALYVTYVSILQTKLSSNLASSTTNANTIIFLTHFSTVSSLSKVASRLSLHFVHFKFDGTNYVHQPAGS